MANVPPPPTLPGVTAVYSGKVRDLYEYPDGTLLFVASDRMSAYDWVLPTTIPDKGRILTAMTLWWFEQLRDLVPNHLVSADVPDAVAGRAMVTRRLDMFPVECVARGYLTGSGLTDYNATGAVCGITLPAGLVDASRLPEPIFTPATKADLGEHDENVDFEAVVKTVGADDAEALRALTLQVYARAEEIARSRGIIVADTKFEFGRHPVSGEIVLADEVLTPDSSRFWPADVWQPGHAQPSFDKQYVRDWLTSSASGWDRHSGEAPPSLPDDVVAQTRAKYVEAYERLTGQQFD
ncbi:MAG TPA: phosphoribosylaminoimidazolesuccinocarboxamide synthase [Actinomycetes bacterium]|nr:phosphoribosylaminoimidazolesuccinocarboxamide synthase [Actinomycetes bacterium]